MHYFVTSFLNWGYMTRNFLTSIIEWADQRGDREAIYFKRDEDTKWSSYSWEQLARFIYKTSASLMYYGIKDQENIGIFSQNMPEWTIADLGIMSAKGVSVPIYATSTTKQAKYIIDEAEIRFLFVGEEDQYQKAREVYFTSESTLEKIIVFDESVEINNDVAIHFTDFLEMGNEISRQTFQEKLNQVTENDLATIIYTSGTTGEPKGVMLTHGNFNVMQRIHDIRLTLDTNDHSLSFLPLSHIFERAWSLYALYKGIKVSILKDPKLIIETLSEVKPTTMCSVPRLYQKAYHSILAKVQKSSPLKKFLFEKAIQASKDYANRLRNGEQIPLSLSIRHRILDMMVLKKIRSVFGGNLRLMPCAGAPLSAEITEFFHALGMPVMIGYGLTETSATVTVFPDKGFKFGTVGVTMPEVEVKIGPDNEIWVKGDTVMKGYYKKPEETAKVFEEGWFKTGDAGSVDEENHLTITDRIKDLMKTSGGKYVAPQPVESLLTNDDYIENAILIGDDKPYVSALLVPNFEALHEYAHSINLKFHSIEELLKTEKIQKFYEQKLEELQESLANFEKVKKFRLLAQDFSMQMEEVTPTLKIRRQIIHKHFSPLIEEIYTL